MAGQIRQGHELRGTAAVDTDVVVVGSGAGGSITAAILAAAGAKVVIVEEGGYFAARDFDLREEVAYPNLYQESGGRATDDLSISILQGRCVGGGTTVNWMTSLRTPESVLATWRERLGTDIDSEDLASHFDAIERRLHIHPAEDADINPNNRVLLDGARRLGYRTTLLPRNTENCTNLGYCSMGCPIDAKKSAALTYLSDAVADDADLFSDCRVVRIERRGPRVTGVEAEIIDRATHQPTGQTLRVNARRVVLAGGAINTPRLLLSTGIRNGATGRRTWLHPVVAAIGLYPRDIHPWEGSPQSVACDEFRDRGERMGYFIETPTLHPMLASLAIASYGATHREGMEHLRRSSPLIALTIDGFDSSEEGGTVSIGRGGRLHFDYRLGSRNEEAIREALKTMTRIHFAAGAEEVMTLHSEPVRMRSESDLVNLDAAPFGPNRLSIFTAHQMGGCAMGRAGTSVVDARGKHHDFDNLYITDGSVFPTSLGVNPMLTIYGVSSLSAHAIARG